LVKSGSKFATSSTDSWKEAVTSAAVSLGTGYRRIHTTLGLNGGCIFFASRLDWQQIKSGNGHSSGPPYQKLLTDSNQYTLQRMSVFWSPRLHSPQGVVSDRAARARS
jgi:hypothetical protein